MKTAVIIDGHHHIEVIKAALQHLTSVKGYNLKAVIFIKGGNLSNKSELSTIFNFPVISEDNPLSSIEKALELYPLDIVVDLSGEPLLSYQDRLQFAQLITGRNAIYEGAGFRFSPPQREAVMRKPSLAFIGTGKRVGKTAFSSYSARILAEKYNPCIVTMGRGGAVQPEVIHGDRQKIYPEDLFKFNENGRHITSDYFEDAIAAGVTTIGSQRCGGGIAGSVYYSNVAKSARIANRLDNDLVLFEGSGAAIPPVNVNVTVLMVAAHQSPAYLEEYVGRFHFIIADVVILTFCEEPLASAEDISKMREYIKKINPGARIIETIFRPEPLVDLAGKRVYYITTAPVPMGDILCKELENKYKCRLIGLSHNLSHPGRICEDVERIENSRLKIDCILTEMKANSLGLIKKTAEQNNIKIALCNYLPILKNQEEKLPRIIIETADLAVERFTKDRWSR